MSEELWRVSELLQACTAGESENIWMHLLGVFLMITMRSLCYNWAGYDYDVHGTET